MNTSHWQSWDGRRLSWRVAAAAPARVELWLDGVLFARTDAAGEYAFAWSPSGREELEFSLRDVQGTLLGPVWRARLGQAAAVGADQWQGAPRALRPLPDAPLPSLEAWAQVRAVAIVVPIYNSPQCVQRCIAAVLRWTHGPARLILIDDASTDPAIAPLLAGYAGHDNILIRRNPQNLGYTRSTNLGIELAGADDVVLLNSDTQVGPRWLERLRLIGSADATIGTVTAVSDNAGAFSVPELEQYCPIPANWSLLQAQRALLQHSGGCLPQLPTGNGFCMLVKRAMLDRVGVLDAVAFPSGYGEENDLCQRGEQAGFRHVIAGDVLVQHARSASFGDTRRAALGAQGMAVLRARYPDYETKVGATLFSHERRVLDYRVRRIYAQAAELAPRPRVLLAGTDKARAATLAAALHDELDIFVLWANGTQWRLYHYDQAELALCAEGALADETALRVWLVRYAIELVHALDAATPTTTMQRVAATVAVPVTAASDNAALADCAHLYAAAWRCAASFTDNTDHSADWA